MGMEEPMKRFAWMLLLITIPGLLFAQDRTRTFIDQVNGGTLSVTNTSKGAAYELKHVSFTIPTSALTNTFSIAHVVRYKLPDVQASLVTTNTGISSGTIGYIETNTVRYAQGYVDLTNSYTVAITSNDVTVQFYDTDDFPKGWSWEWNDIQTFTFSDTNAINLIRVYDVYPRP